jgi:hypothetical protein
MSTVRFSPSPLSAFAAAKADTTPMPAGAGVAVSAEGGEDVFIPSTAPVTLDPATVADLKARILRIAREHTNDTERSDIAAARLELNPLVAQLARHFAANRPADELAMTQRGWHSVYFDDPDIDRQPAFLKLNRSQVYQVVEDGFYYNIAKQSVVACGVPLLTLRSFLKGEYTVKELPPVDIDGLPRPNVIQLRFVDNRASIGDLPAGASLEAQVRFVDSISTEPDAFRRFLQGIQAPQVPGPYGKREVRGELWNVYLDADLRICYGRDETNPGVVDLYILTASDRVVA